MNAELLIEMLEKMPDKTLPIRLAVPKEGGSYQQSKYWLNSMFVKDGEVTLWGTNDITYF